MRTVHVSVGRQAFKRRWGDKLLVELCPCSLEPRRGRQVHPYTGGPGKFCEKRETYTIDHKWRERVPSAKLTSKLVSEPMCGAVSGRAEAIGFGEGWSERRNNVGRDFDGEAQAASWRDDIAMRRASGLEDERRRIVTNDRRAVLFTVSAVEHEAETRAVAGVPWNPLVRYVIALGDIEAGRGQSSNRLAAGTIAARAFCCHGSPICRRIANVTTRYSGMPRSRLSW